MLVFSALIQGLRVAFDLQHIGDLLNWILRILPSYSVPTAFYFASMGAEIASLRENLEGTGDPIDPD